MRSQHSTHQNKSKAFFQAPPKSHCRWRKESSFHGRKNAVFKVRKIPLLSNTTKRRCLHISEDLLKQLLVKLQKAQLFDIYLDETTDISEEVHLILCCRFANQELKTIGVLCCLNVGACSTAQAIFARLNQFIEKRGFDRMRHKAVATNGAAEMQRTPNGVVRKIKNISLNCVSTSFLELFGHRPKLFWNDRKNLSQFGHNANFSQTKMSQNEKMTENFNLFWKNDRNVSAKINPGNNSLLNWECVVRD